jgi:hypothetical protein
MPVREISSTMKIQLLILILTISSLSSLAQPKSKYERKKVESFIFIEPAINTASLKFIRTFKCVSNEGDDIPSLLRAVREQAQKIGANSYKFNSFTRNDSTGIMTLVLDTYLASEKMLELNSAMHEDNVIYIFCDDKFSDRQFSFKINGEQKSIKSGTYYKYVMEVDSAVVINTGGLTGTTLKVDWEIGSDARYISITGPGFSDIPQQTNTLTVQLTTGKIHTISANLGSLLIRTLKTHE